MEVIDSDVLDEGIVGDLAGDVGRARVCLVNGVLGHKQELIGVVTEGEVLDPSNEGGNMLHVVSASKKESEHDD